MIIERPLPFIKNYLEIINVELKRVNPEYCLSTTQRLWLGFCLSAILITNSICWKRFERASLGSFKDSALSWMFHFSKICFMTIFQMSIEQILGNYGITEGVICIDDVDRARSKSTQRIHRVHKFKDKLTGGYCEGQSLVFLFLVTPVASFPIGFEFYAPDPQWKVWKKEEDRLKKAKVPKKQRPVEPDRNPEFPTKVEISLQLVSRFQQRFPELSIKAVLADGLYGHAEFVDGVKAIYPSAQVITKMKTNQLARFRGKDIHISEYFRRFPPVSTRVSVRGGEEVEIFVSSARLYVPSHGQKRFVIAIRYPDEKECRYLLASDLSWRTLDIVQAYFFRWLIEVFFEDWKGHEGWGTLTKHPGKEGSWKTVILSLMLDHALLFHQRQKARLENKLPALSVGSLSQRIQAEALVQFVEDLTQDGLNEQKLQKLKECIDKVIPLNPSKKHMAPRLFPKMDPAPSLKRFRKVA